MLWLTLIYASFGLFAPANGTAVVALCLSSLAIAGSIFLIVEMSQPFGGLIRISSMPMRNALATMER